MKYYISDLHFGHARINDRIDHRGFETVEDMDAYMINCFCMFSDYIPLTLDEWIRADRKRNIGLGNA